MNRGNTRPLRSMILAISCSLARTATGARGIIIQIIGNAEEWHVKMFRFLS